MNTTIKAENTVKQEKHSRTAEHLLFLYVSELNGRETEEELNMTIVKELIKNDIKLEDISSYVHELESDIDTEKVLSEGVYVFENNDLYNWKFDRYDTIADAVRAAVLMINAKIMHNGEQIIFDALSDTEAYYIDDSTEKVMIVTL